MSPFLLVTRYLCHSINESSYFQMNLGINAFLSFFLCWGKVRLFKENSLPCHFSGILYKTFGYKLIIKLLANLPQINRTMNIYYKKRVYQSYF